MNFGGTVAVRGIDLRRYTEILPLNGTGSLNGTYNRGKNCITGQEIFTQSEAALAKDFFRAEAIRLNSSSFERHYYELLRTPDLENKNNATYGQC